jgi:hypothetical protein
MIPFLILLLYVVNATVPVTIPLQISPNAAPPVTANAASTAAPNSILGFPIDAATISSVIALASGFIYKSKKTDTKQSIQTETTAKVADSVKETDYGAKEIVNLLAKIVDNVPNLDEQTKQQVKAAAQEWNSDVAALYEKNSISQTDLSSDPIVKKLGEVQKMTERHR